jgi:hypothetical protein
MDCLRVNGYEEAILNFLRKGDIFTLFDKLEYNVDGRLCISDLTLALKENISSHKMSAKE